MRLPRERSAIRTAGGTDSVDCRRGLERLRASSLSLVAAIAMVGGGCSELTTKEPVNGVKPVPPSSAPPVASQPANAPASPTSPFASSMKGWELYGWLEDDRPRFVLTIGTNFAKGCSDVKGAPPDAPGPPRFSADGVVEVKALLARVPAGDTIFWLGNPCGLPSPAPGVVSELKAFAGNERLIIKP